MEFSLSDSFGKALSCGVDNYVVAVYFSLLAGVFLVVGNIRVLCLNECAVML